MPRTALQLPVREKPNERLGRRLWRKQVLPVAQIEYRGRTLDFTPAYLERLSRNFNASALDQVPFLLATPQNEHNEDPERYRGEVKGIELTPDGLYAVIETTDDGSKLLEANPRLGVSARILEDHPQGPVLAHVLGTLDPKVTGMKPWEQVNLTSDGDRVLDLTASVYNEKGMDALSDTEVAQLRTLLAASNGSDASDKTTGSDNTDKTPAADADKKAPLTEAELDAILARLAASADDSDESDDDTADDKVPAGAGAELSAEHRQAIDLANNRAQDAQRKAAELASRLAAAEFKTEQDQLLRAGLPPALINLAKPVLERSDPAVIELSNSEKLDVTKIVRDLLSAVADPQFSKINLSVIGRDNPGQSDSEADEGSRVADGFLKRTGMSPAKASAA